MPLIFSNMLNHPQSSTTTLSSTHHSEILTKKKRMYSFSDAFDDQATESPETLGSILDGTLFKPLPKRSFSLDTTTTSTPYISDRFTQLSFNYKKECSSPAISSHTFTLNDLKDTISNTCNLNLVDPCDKCEKCNEKPHDTRGNLGEMNQVESDSISIYCCGSRMDGMMSEETIVYSQTGRKFTVNKFFQSDDTSLSIEDTNRERKKVSINVDSNVKKLMERFELVNK